ncbi:hypothetical protein C1645_811438 [Glomus cerebriforme]|uniref:F-box domain-containing protein n=1 Tax=Glomus cerebriforme TaxID=658196 RepID=A0A397TX35_9GLOM|nr:hypothetical protein C1645_811438 [Glomus cerebriforme]
MVYLNKDVIILILEELQNDKNFLLSCLLVNKTWCETTIPILWKNPWKDLTRKNEKLQSNVIISHFSNETREKLKNYNIILSEDMQQKLSFNYIGYCRYLELYRLERIICSFKKIQRFQVPIIKSEILKLFINRNTRFTHLYIHLQFNYQIHYIPGAEICFSGLKFLRCHPHDLLDGLSKISKKIEELEFYVTDNDNYEIIKLIEVQKNLNDVRFIYNDNVEDESFCKTLEESLIKHADTVQYLKIDRDPKSLSYLVNLISLEINSNHQNLSYLENVSLPYLKILKTQRVSSKILSSLIENTKGNLMEINIDYDSDGKRLIQAIYQSCPNLKYLKLSLKNNNNISELDNLLINCQHLNGLVISTCNSKEFDWDNLFKSLTRSSPISLFKFKLFSVWCLYSLKSLKIFFENWKGRHPMLLHTSISEEERQYFDLIEKYETEGIIKRRHNYLDKATFEDFEWIHPTQKADI